MINTIEQFQRITKFPLAEFLIQSKSFFSNEFNEIVSFYSGNTKTLDNSHIKKLNVLAEQAQYLQQIFRNKKNTLDSIDYWELLTIIEDIKVKINTSKKISKYLRSSITASSNKSGFLFETILENNETLEDVNFKKLEETNENSWVDIALENELKEIDWDINGGKNIKVRKKIFQADLVTSMIDNTIGEKVYGLDIKKKFNYKDDDLEVLSHNNTVLQTVDILSTLSKGDIPEYRNLGINFNLYKGSNFSQLNFPSIVREMNKNFATDDLFMDFNVRNIEYNDGSIFIEFEVNTKYELVIIKNITI